MTTKKKAKPHKAFCATCGTAGSYRPDRGETEPYGWLVMTIIPDPVPTGDGEVLRLEARSKFFCVFSCFIAFYQRGEKR